MYDIIKNIIDHTYSGGYSNGEEAYLYYICGSLIILFVILMFDTFRRLFRRFIGK